MGNEGRLHVLHRGGYFVTFECYFVFDPISNVIYSWRASFGWGRESPSVDDTCQQPLPCFTFESVPIENSLKNLYVNNVFKAKADLLALANKL